MAKKPKRESLTYGEVGHGVQIVSFIRWLNKTKTPMPKTNDDINRVVIDYLLYDRKVMYDEVKKRLQEQDEKRKSDIGRRPVKPTRAEHIPTSRGVSGSPRD